MALERLSWLLLGKIFLLRKYRRYPLIHTVKHIKSHAMALKVPSKDSAFRQFIFTKSVREQNYFLLKSAFYNHQSSIVYNIVMRKLPTLNIFVVAIACYLRCITVSIGSYLLNFMT